MYIVMNSSMKIYQAKQFMGLYLMQNNSSCFISCKTDKKFRVQLTWAVRILFFAEIGTFYTYACIVCRLYF